MKHVLNWARVRSALLVAAIVLSADAAMAGSFDNFVYVPSDTALRAAGKTRAQFNYEHPAAEKQWRTAWAAAGKKNDNKIFVDIRKTTSKPQGLETQADAKPAASAPAPTGKGL